MRVVGGTLGGRVFAGPKGQQTRPTSERVREGLTSALQSRGAIDHAYVLDAFAGTGALAFEALSRGAAHATLVDHDKRMVRGLSQSIRKLELGSRSRVFHNDMIRTPGKVLKDTPHPYSLVFVDPPYDELATLGLFFKTLKRACAPGALLVVEAAFRTPFDITIHPFLSAIADYRYGDTSIVFAEFSK